MHAVFGEESEASPTSEPERGWGRQIHGALQKPGALWCWNHPYEKTTTTHRRNGYFLQRKIDCLILQDVQEHCGPLRLFVSIAMLQEILLLSHPKRWSISLRGTRCVSLLLLFSLNPDIKFPEDFCDESGTYLSQRDWHTLNKQG